MISLLLLPFDLISGRCRNEFDFAKDFFHNSISRIIKIRIILNMLATQLNHMNHPPIFHTDPK